MEQQKPKSIGLWINKKKDSEEIYFSGTLPDGKKVTIYQNKFKEQGDKKPDFNMYINDAVKKDAPEAAPAFPF